MGFQLMLSSTRRVMCKTKFELRWGESTKVLYFL